jgi:hypothetical protein
MGRVLYLHGFASSPASSKARIFKELCAAAGVELEALDLVEGPFRELTITRQLRVVERAARGEAVSLIGSSLGGYLAALYAARQPEVERLVLLAPAFGFARRWAGDLGPEKMAEWERTGVTKVMHHGQGGMAELGWHLMADARLYEEEPAFGQPALIFHGIHDAVVPVEASRRFARGRANVQLREMDSDHQLLDVVEAMWAEIRAFLA